LKDELFSGSIKTIILFIVHLKLLKKKC